MSSEKYQVVIGMLVSTLLFGCGGSSGGDSNEQQVSIEEEANTGLISNEGADEKMANLIASEDFEFTQKSQIQVELDLREALVELDAIDQRAYVSIYGEYQMLDSGEYFATVSSRVLAGELKSGFFSNEFTQLTMHSAYLVEVWFYNGEPPIQALVSLQDNRLTF